MSRGNRICEFAAQIESRVNVTRIWVAAPQKQMSLSAAKYNAISSPCVQLTI
jgi:hypothetical protein